MLKVADIPILTIVMTPFTVHALRSSPFLFVFGPFSFSWNICWNRHLRSEAQPWFPSHVQTNGWNFHKCKHQTLVCGDRMRVWCRNNSPDEWSRWLERRAGDEKKGRGERWMVAVRRVTAKLQVLFWLFMSFSRLTPLPPPSSLLLHSPLLLASVFFQYSISATQ